MKRVKNKIKNTAIDGIEELNSILDSNYFHVCTSIQGDKVEWSIYYKNLNEKEYYSDENKPLLTSKENTISDIYELRDRFERAKEKEFIENKYIVFRDSFKIYSAMNEIKYKGIDGMLNIFTFYELVTLIISISLDNAIYSIINLFICILGTIYLIYQQKSIKKLMDKKIEETREFIIRNIIKNKGLEFIERIRENEMHRDRL